MSAVKISNLSPAANETTLREFFAFCGTITDISIHSDGLEHFAVIKFDNESSGKTATILSNALVVDRPISVHILTAEEQKSSEAAASHSDLSETQKKPSYAAELLASAIVGAKTLDSQYNITGKTKAALAATATTAKQYDEKLHITATTTEKMKQIDEEHHIVDKLAAARIQTEIKAKEIDEKYAVKATTQAVSYIALEKTQELATAAMANPTVAKTMGWLSSSFASLKQSVSSVAAETKELVNQQSGVPAVATTAAPALAPAEVGRHTISDTVESIDDASYDEYEALGLDSAPAPTAPSAEAAKGDAQVAPPTE